MDAEFSSPLSESNSPAGLANGVQGNSYGPYSRKLVARGRSFLSRVTARVGLPIIGKCDEKSLAHTRFVQKRQFWVYRWILL